MRTQNETKWNVGTACKNTGKLKQKPYMMNPFEWLQFN